jgi:hypothetical protein
MAYSAAAGMGKRFSLKEPLTQDEEIQAWRSNW